MLQLLEQNIVYLLLEIKPLFKEIKIGVRLSNIANQTIESIIRHTINFKIKLMQKTSLIKIKLNKRKMINKS